MNLLVIEPHGDVCYLIKEFIRRKISGCEVKTTNSTQDAAAIILQESFGGIVIGSFKGAVVSELAALANIHQPGAFLVLFAVEPGAISPQVPWAAVVPHADFPRLVAKIQELVGSAGN